MCYWVGEWRSGATKPVIRGDHLRQLHYKAVTWITRGQSYKDLRKGTRWHKALTEEQIIGTRTQKKANLVIAQK